MDPTIDEPILEPVAVEPTPTARAAAFTTLAEEEIDAAYRLATLILRDAVEAEDAVHDAFVTAWRNWASLRDPARFDAWFGRILLNVCRMRLRARRRQGGLVDISTVLGASSRDPDPAVVAGQRDAIERGFSRLSPDHRIVVVDATPASIALDDTPCAGPGLDRIDAGASALLWSPAGDRIAAVCSSAVTVYKTLDRSAHTISVPKGTLIVSAAWSASPYHVIVATAKAGASQLGPLTVLSLGADSGASQVLASSQLSVEWVLPGTLDGFSPDGHWLVVDGGLPESVPGADFQDQLYVVDLQSGATRPLAPPSALLGSFIGWMPDSSGAVFSGSFSAEDVSGVRHSFVQVAPGDLARTTMGSLPKSSYGSVLLWRPTGVP